MSDQTDILKKLKIGGYQRLNGRWEARFRPQSRWELKRTRNILSAYKGFRNGVYKYEFLNYFDTKCEKDEWLIKIKQSFNEWREEARRRCEGINSDPFEMQEWRLIKTPDTGKKSKVKLKIGKHRNGIKVSSLSKDDGGEAARQNKVVDVMIRTMQMRRGSTKVSNIKGVQDAVAWSSLSATSSFESNEDISGKSTAKADATASNNSISLRLRVSSKDDKSYTKGDVSMLQFLLEENSNAVLSDESDSTCSDELALSLVASDESDSTYGDGLAVSPIEAHKICEI